MNIFLLLLFVKYIDRLVSSSLEIYDPVLELP